MQDHLLAKDGAEAAAILICTAIEGRRTKLLLKQVLLIPYVECTRSADSIDWPGQYLDRALAVAEKENLSIILIHSHPGGYFDFSTADDRADRAVMPALFSAGRPSRQHPRWHGSAIMVPGGAIKARLYGRNKNVQPVELVAVYGDDIHLYWSDRSSNYCLPLIFSEAMSGELSRLSVAVIGVSGTGSLVAEQLLRLGIGELVVVDHDHVETKNLNRIINTTYEHATKCKEKVAVFKEAAARIRPQTNVLALPTKIDDRTTLMEVAEADVIFCCVDSESGRHICDLLASAALQPLFDVGVTMPVRRPEKGVRIASIAGRVDYVQPAGSTLADREVYTPASLVSEELASTDPKAYEQRVRDGYMPGAGEQAPSVITVNMRAACTVVQEFLARLYPYRLKGNERFSRISFELLIGQEEHRAESTFPKNSLGVFATGLREPLLGLPKLDRLP
ncbi:ThiF family adenylyltransferase [Lysobacter gummosus]|uniref:ThiF family adenylyltransferase n=2 Tax=Lysobacter gummosus TaxID=262324 RepID=UPI00363F7AE6